MTVEKKRKNIVIGGQKQAQAEIKPIGSDDPQWLKEVKEIWPSLLTFHALIRELYKHYRKTNPEVKARVLAIVDASKKVMVAEDRASVLKALADGSPLRDAIESEDLELSDTDDLTELEASILDSLDEVE